MENIGSTSIIETIQPGILLKQPIQFKSKDLAERVDLCFSVEPLILQQLGEHPRIVRYLGQQGRGLLLGQASHGNLQAYIDSNPSIDLRQRVLWCEQLAEAISYIHHRGVIHSDLRPANVLVHESTPGSRDLLLCDFGGSTCNDLGLDGGSLPDCPFYHPAFGCESSPALDIFSLGSLFYTILTGYWPYRSTPGQPETMDETISYEQAVAEAYDKCEVPDLTGIAGGSVILGCWTKRYETAEEVLRALKKEMPTPMAEGGFLEVHYSSVLMKVLASVAALAVLTHVLMQRQTR